MMSDSDSGTVLIDKNSEREPTGDSPKPSEKTSFWGPFWTRFRPGGSLEEPTWRT